jgi:hypothetical protein
MKFETASGSLYEVDEEKKSVRRLIGVQSPTPRQGNDGEWREYLDITDINVGQGVLFVWSMIPGIISTGKSTLTSPVKRILTDEDQA